MTNVVFFCSFSNNCSSVFINKLLLLIPILGIYHFSWNQMTGSWSAFPMFLCTHCRPHFHYCYFKVMSLILFISKWTKCSYPHCWSVFWVKARQSWKVLQAGYIFEADATRCFCKVPHGLLRFPRMRLQRRQQEETCSIFHLAVTLDASISFIFTMRVWWKQKPSQHDGPQLAINLLF